MRGLADAAVEGLMVCDDRVIVTVNTSFLKPLSGQDALVQATVRAALLSTAGFAALELGSEDALRALHRTESPPFVLNLTGPETLRVRDIAREFGRRFGVEPHFTGAEHPTALLSNASLCHRLFGMPSLKAQDLMDLTAAWILRGGATLGKPTHFEMREGKF